jgi:hypothetical protein
MAQYSEKNFNENAFGKYVEMAPNDHVNMFMKAGIFESASEEARRLPDQAGGNYISEPVKGRLDGEVLNYDGTTNNEPTSRGTFVQDKVVIGRMKAWEENDFATDIAGAEFLPVNSMAGEVAEYYETVDQADLLAILEGIFAMADEQGADFVAKHTNNVGAASANALNNTITKASGDKRTAYSVAIMHSAAAAEFEGLQLLEYTKYTDAQGIERPLAIGRLNGKTVLVDDEVPAKEVEGGVEYTTYILGKGAFEYSKLAVKNPYKMAYDAERNGGVTALYTKTRKIIAPKWISFTKASMAKLSPSVAELKMGANWEIVNNKASGEAKKYVNHKNIPIARMIVKVND